MRPMAKLGFVFFLCLAVASFFCVQNQLLMSIVLLILAVVLFFIKSKRKTAVLILSGAFAVGYMAGYTQFVYIPSQQYGGATAQLAGTIIEKETNETDVFYTLQVSEINGQPVRFSYKATVYSDVDIGADYYDQLRIEAKLYTTASGEQLRLEDYQRAKGIFLTASPVKGSTIAWTKTENKPLSVACLHLRDRLIESIDRYVDTPQNELVTAILFGQKSGVAFTTLQDFRRAGMSHMLAVSGLHLVILSQMLLLVLGLFRVRKKPAHLCTILFVLVFMTMVGFTASVVRAGIMTIVYLCACFLKRESDSLNSLGFAAWIILLVSPYAVADVSFLLSFCATLGIILLTGRISAKLNALCRFQNVYAKTVVENFSVSLSAVLFTIPITILAFYEISLIAPVSNLVATPIVSIVLVGGLLTGITGAFVPIQVIPELLGNITQSVAWGLSEVAGWFADIPYAYLPLGFDFLSVWLICAGILLSLALLSKHRWLAVKLVALLSTVLVLAGSFSYMLWNKSVIHLAVIGNRYGYSIVLTYDGRATVINCGGSSYSGRNTYNYLCAKGIDTIDSMILTSLNKSCAQGGSFLIEQCAVRSLIIPDNGVLYEELAHAANTKQVPISTLGNMKITVADYLEINLNVAFKRPVVTVRFPHFSLAYSENAGSLNEVMGQENVNIALTNGEISSSFAHLQASYAIILGDNGAANPHILSADSNGLLELSIGYSGKVVVRSD